MKKLNKDLENSAQRNLILFLCAPALEGSGGKRSVCVQEAAEKECC